MLLSSREPKSLNHQKQNEAGGDWQQNPDYAAHIPPPSLVFFPFALHLGGLFLEQTSRLKLKAMRLKSRAARRRMYPPRGAACDFHGAGGSLIFFSFSSLETKKVARVWRRSLP